MKHKLLTEQVLGWDNHVDELDRPLCSSRSDDLTHDDDEVDCPECLVLLVEHALGAHG